MVGSPACGFYWHYIDFDRDTRNLGNPMVQYVESHSDDVTEVCTQSAYVPF
jgi:hypothetical protein